MLDDQTDLHDGYAEVGDDIKLHYVEAGDGPLVVLLHGFPEFWFSWRLQIAPLAAAGFRVVAPDLRGYNLSSRPEGVEAYGADKVADDIRGLIRELGAESALLVGHDFGGTVAWATAMAHPEVVDRLVILDAAHPRRLHEGAQAPEPAPEALVLLLLPASRAARAHRARQELAILPALPARCPARAYTPEETERYIESWSQPGAATAIIDYYRAAVGRRRSGRGADPPDPGAHAGDLGTARPLPRADWPSPSATMCPT